MNSTLTASRDANMTGRWVALYAPRASSDDVVEIKSSVPTVNDVARATKSSFCLVGQQRVH